jgi:CHAT domain-containing protein
LGRQRRQRFQAASRELYVTLFEPVEELIASTDRLLILPDGPLHHLPFAALIRGTANGGSGGQYLVEWRPIHVALSATVYAELKVGRRGDRDAPVSPNQVAAFGDPRYPQSLTATEADSEGDSPSDAVVRSAAERGIFDWQPLPYTRQEVEGIASLFADESVQSFLGAEALEERIKSLDPRTRILHIAAHGYIDEHLPSSSFLALTIPKNPGPDQDNGLLQMWEILERVRIDADLVVLSACESGLGKELRGEGLIGLTRAFHYAGARSVVASLWSVADQTTAELMLRFYRHLRSGLPKDEALRAAQLELIRGPIEVTDNRGRRVLKDASAPFYWAAFQVYGDWQ